MELIQHQASEQPPPRTTGNNPTPELSPTDIVSFVRARLAFDPDEKQCEVLRSTARRGILNCTRQWGKTTVSAAKAVHRVFTVPRSTVVIASPGARQSGEWMRRAAEMLAMLGIEKHTDGYNKISLSLPNGSRIVGLPEVEAKVRGFSALSMLLIDEAARVSDEMYKALRPMLSVGDGDLWLMSTPFGKRGFFYDAWQHGGDRWHRVCVKATDCPRISPAFLEEQRSVMGSAAFEQEHMCEFVGSGLNAFDRDIVEQALDENVEALGPGTDNGWNPNIPAWLQARADQSFYVGLDLGKKQDYSTIAVVESSDNLLLVRSVERIPLGTPYIRVVEIVRDLVRSPRLRGRCVVTVDASGVGEPVMEMLRRSDLGCSIRAVVITSGFIARASGPSHTNVPKVDLMAGLQLALETRRLRIARKMKEAGALVNELLDIRVNSRGGMSADGSGEHDDLVMAVALACWTSKRGWNTGPALLI